MRILALQMDGKALKEQFIAAGEEEILTTTHHPLVFIATLVIVIPLAVIVLMLTGFALAVSDTTAALVGTILFFLIGAIWCLHFFIKAYIDWRYDCMIVTTEKVVIVDYYSIFYQSVIPIHLEDIASTRFESQFFGIWRCGIVHMRLQEREGGTTRQVTRRFVPQPDVVASAIENAIALSRQREQGTKVEEQLPKVQEVQQKVQESVQKEAPTTPTVEPAAQATGEETQ